jgi:hypothetical protein
MRDPRERQGEGNPTQLTWISKNWSWDERALKEQEDSSQVLGRRDFNT